MDPRRAKTERNMLPSVGASFYREGGEILFTFVIDPANVVGPRPATRGDQEKHPGAWAAFSAAEGVSSLDRDAKDGAGGSLPVESPPKPVVETVTLSWNEKKATLEAGDGAAFVTKDGATHPTLRAAADHAEAAPKPKRKYTRRKG